MLETTTARKFPGSKLIIVAAVFVLTIFSFMLGAIHPSQEVRAETIGWVSPTRFDGNIGNIIIRVRPSDGRVVIIGENVAGVNKEGGSLYYMSDGDGFKLHTLSKLPNNDPTARYAKATFDKNSTLHVVWSEHSGDNGRYQVWHYRIAADNALTGDNPGNLKWINPLSSDAYEVSKPDIAANSFAGSDGKIYISWQAYVAGKGNYPQVVDSFDNGETWGNPHNLAQPLGGYTQWPHLSVAPNNFVYVGFKREDPGNVYGTVRTDKGWQPVQNLSNNNLNVVMEVATGVDSNSVGYISFDIPNNTGRGLSIARWRPSAPGWNVKPNVTGTLDGRVKALSMALTGDGTEVLAMQFNEVGLRYLSSTNAGESWTPAPYGKILDNGSVFGVDIAWWNNRIHLAAKVTDFNGKVGVLYTYATGGGGIITPPPPPTPPPPTTPPPTLGLTAPQAANTSDPTFLKVWSRTDKPIFTGAIARSWTWGDKPDGFALLLENYSGQQRLVQYHDKSRMEINNPQGNRADLFFVSNGLLVREMIQGQIQISDTDYVARQPSDTAVTGDPINGISPTYSSFRGIASLYNDKRVANRVGQPLTESLNKDGTISTLTPPVQLTYAYYEDNLGHNIPDVFWNFMNSRGKVLVNDALQDDVVVNWVYTMGYPLSDAYWTRSIVGGVERDVLVQVFERRVLSYTPSNPADFQVEMGNVGRHYYQWRYGG